MSEGKYGIDNQSMWWSLELNDRGYEVELIRNSVYYKKNDLFVAYTIHENAHRSVKLIKIYPEG